MYDFVNRDRPVWFHALLALALMYAGYWYAIHERKL